MGLNDSFSATKLKSEQKYLGSASISYFAFCFTGFVLLFPCLKLSTTLSPSVPLFHVGTEVATAPAQEQDQNGSLAPVACLLKFCSLALQEVS